jgi:hypothetical protein
MGGIGDNTIYLNEFLDWERATHDFETLRAYDEARYRLLESERRLDYPTSADKPYCGSLFLTEARLRMDGRCCEVTLSMAAGYVFSQLCDASSALLKNCIPYRYVAGKHHGRVEGKYRRWHMRIDANGQEAIVEELLWRIRTYEQERFDTLLTRWDAASRSCVYFVEDHSASEARPHIIFSDKEALERVRFRSFISDCRAIESPSRALEEAVDEEKALLARFIHAEHAELIRTYDPKIVRMREKYRMALSTP